MTKSQGIFIAFGILFFLFIGCAVYFNGNYNLNKIKSKTVGDGQYGTARFATDKEVHQSLKYIEFDSVKWRKGIDLPKSQGLVVGSKINFGKTFGYVDCDDIHLLMIGAAGVGKTAHFLYPNLEYACASGVSFITTDTKGDLYRNYGGIAHDYYGYNISVIDLRNPLFSDGNNMLHMVNKYMDQYKQNRNDLSLKAKTEKYAKIIAKTIIFSDGESASSYGQNSFFYDSAEGLLTSIILIISEFCDDGERHIVSVFKLVQDLLKPSGIKGKTQFQILLDYLPDNHKAKWFAGAALNTGEQAMMSVLSTVLSRLNVDLFQTAVPALGQQVEGGQRIDFIVPVFHTGGLVHVRRVDVHDIAAYTELARAVHLTAPDVPGGKEPRHQRFPVVDHAGLEGEGVPQELIPGHSVLQQRLGGHADGVQPPARQRAQHRQATVLVFAARALHRPQHE